MTSSKRLFKNRTLMALVSVGLAAALLLVVAISLILNRDPRPGETPESAVEAYLTALSEADAAAALEVIDAPPDTTHMTDDVLAQSLRLEQINRIEVEEIYRMDSDSVEEKVQATFMRERTHHDTNETRFSFDTQLNEETGLWEIHDAAVRIPRPEVGDLDLRLNGEPFDAEETYVFWWPRYELTFDQEYFEFGHKHSSGREFHSHGPGNPIRDMEARLTEEGEDAWRKAVVDDLNGCLTSTDRLAGCGLDIPEEVDGNIVEDGNVSRSFGTYVSAQSMKRISPQIDPEQLPLVYVRDWTPTIHVKYDASGDGTAEELEYDAGEPHYPRVDMGADDEQEVEWLEPRHGDLPREWN